MPAGLEVYGPTGALWLSITQKTSRLIGALVYAAPTALITVDFTVQAGEVPFRYWQGSNGLFMAYMTMTALSGTTWRLQFQVNRMAGSSGGAMRLFYGVG